MERRYQMLRPSEVITLRKECPVVYIPLGVLEWHGPHNPLGADGIQAEALSIMCAEKGGLAFPPLYYGENRPASIMEGNGEDRFKIAKEMKLDPDDFLQSSSLYSSEEQEEFYRKLLMRILFQAETLGFKVAVLIAGHYPLIDPAKDVAL